MADKANETAKGDLKMMSFFITNNAKRLAIKCALNLVPTC